MSTVTRLRELPNGRVAVELDGARWRTIPLDVVARVGLGVGEELERPRLRELARELRRARAVDTALRAVARRDQSAASLHQRLRRRGVAPSLREATVARLTDVGLVDDRRYAVRRAESLAERGYGDAAISWRLGREGVAEAVVEEAVVALEPEGERVRRIVAARGRGPATARDLARRGFGEDAVEAAVGPGVADAP